MLVSGVSERGQTNAEANRVTDRTHSEKTPPDLFGQAAKLFPEPLARQVQEGIARDLQTAMSDRPPGPVEQSLTTYFLADKFYSKLGIGRYEEAPRIIWNGFDKQSEVPMFVYEMSAFAYVTASGRRIVPGTMDTDGGSIPKILHSIGSFTPWGYGPAYLIHDWIFAAHKCGIAPDSNIAFEDAASYLAEAIKTLMEAGFVNYDKEAQIFRRKEDTLYLIYKAVSSDFARDIWKDMNNIKCRKAS